MSKPAFTTRLTHLALEEPDHLLALLLLLDGLADGNDHDVDGPANT